MTYTKHEQRLLDQDSGAVWDCYVAKRIEFEHERAAQKARQAAMLLKLERTQDIEQGKLAR